ncbi:MAG: FGGY-family carbohydrate kinase [Acidobacteriota bacterium]|nr:FGGY-family carbohydrate kinase [Acidobacteriota bacterium]
MRRDPANERHILAIDLGTGALKAALVSRSGELRAGAIRRIRTRELPGGGAEQDPGEWWSALCSATREALQASGLAPGAVCAIRCVTQWAVTVPVDRAGQALTPAISWMDTRGGPYVRRLVGGPLRISGYGPLKLRRWISLTGGAPVRSGIDSLGHILYLKHERPEVYEAAHSFLEPMDYLNLRLCGRFAASMGTIFPYWLTDNRDPSAIDYHPTLLALAGVDRAKLPEIVPVDAVVGRLSDRAAGEVGLAAGTPVLAGTPDGQVAGVGAGATGEGTGYFYVGTSSWMSCHAPSKRTDLIHMVATMPSALPGRYVVTAEQGFAGRCLEFLKDNILYPPSAYPDGPPEDVHDVMEREAAAVPAGSEGLMFTPWINGVLVPREDPRTRSMFFNQSWRTTRGHYVRAVMEGVAHNMRWLKPHVERIASRRFEQLNFIGGGALSDLWCQIHADILGCRVGQIANPRYANAVGAALAGFHALGDLALDELDGRVRVAAVYEPDGRNAELYASRQREFLRLYRRNRAVYRRLN